MSEKPELPKDFGVKEGLAYVNAMARWDPRGFLDTCCICQDAPVPINELLYLIRLSGVMLASDRPRSRTKILIGGLEAPRVFACRPGDDGFVLSGSVPVESDDLRICQTCRHVRLHRFTGKVELVERMTPST